jgi:zeaxanthin glucosyltransferase
VAARVAWSGSGAVVPLKRASVPWLRAAVDRVWGDPSYRQNAQRLQQAITSSVGVDRAVDIVEQAISTGQPVL